MQALWLYLHFPSLQLDTLFAQEAHEQPVIILEASENRVVQYNREAAEKGISLGMGLGTAAALAADLQVLPYQIEIEQQKLLEVAQQLYQVTSDICLYPPNGLLLRIHTMLHLYGDLATYWQTLKNSLRSIKLEYHYATGISPLSARLLARTRWNTITAERPLIERQLNRCAIQSIELPAKAVHSLNSVGIKTLAELLTLSLKELSKRFDIELVTYLGRLTGQLQHQVRFFHPPEQFQRYVELLFDIENTAHLLRPIESLLEGLSQFLCLRDQVTDEIKLTLHLRDQESQHLTIASAEGESRSQAWLELIELQFEQLTLAAPVFALSMTTGAVQARQANTEDFFAGRRGIYSPVQLISRLQAKLGKNAVYGLALKNDHRPEIASTYCEPLSRGSSVSPAYGCRPAFLLKPAVPLQEPVTLLHGPERLVSGWWDSQPVGRDYFIARNQAGQWLWVYRTEQSHWYVHGLFS